nr:nicotinamide mononucleotide transporter [Lachnospiraceae bacterium]
MSSTDEKTRGGFMQRPLSIRIKKILTVLLAAATLALIALSVTRILQKTEVTEQFPAHFVRVTEAGEEEYEDETVCPVEYETEDGAYTCVVNYTFEEWEALPTGHEIDGFVYRLSDGRALGFDHVASEAEIRAAVRDLNTDANRSTLSIALALGLMAVSFLLMVLWGHFFTDYEQIWFLSIMVLAGVISILVPEEDVNGVKGVYIMAMYLLDTFLNILCELLIAKQSKWNFIVSVFVEITEIVICIVLAYRFATLATTLFFWLPIDIISFINWHKHPDRQEEELTRVRKLSGKTRALILTAIAVWTVVVGYFLSGLSIRTDLFGGNATVETLVAYLDACVSAVAVVNGVLIFLRYQEQWIAWMVDAVLEGVINILSGQYVLLVLKAGYITNSTYGYVKWRKYIRTHEKEEQNLLSL